MVGSRRASLQPLRQVVLLAIVKAMANLLVLERHLWSNLTEIKDTDKVTVLYFPVIHMGLLGHAVNVFAERFTEAQ